MEGGREGEGEGGKEGEGGREREGGRENNILREGITSQLIPSASYVIFVQYRM